MSMYIPFIVLWYVQKRGGINMENLETRKEFELLIDCMNKEQLQQLILQANKFLQSSKAETDHQ